MRVYSPKFDIVLVKRDSLLSKFRSQSSRRVKVVEEEKNMWWKQRADFHQVAHTWLMCDGNWHKNAWFVDSCMGHRSALF